MVNDIESIKERNKRVEIDKAWETSITRRIIIAIMTYIVIVIFLFSINAINPFLNAIVPTVGFILSTLTLSFFKRFWINNIYKKKF
jgi:preprotein translocase subunit SecF